MEKSANNTEATCVDFPHGPAKGWYKIAFDREVEPGVSAWRIGAKRLMLVREGDQIRAFNGDCPHRGAELGRGWILNGNAVVCPFHHYAIKLGTGSGLCVQEYQVAQIANMVLISLTEDSRFDLIEKFNDLLSEHQLVEALTIRVKAPMSLIIENAFDFKHFFGVHGVQMKETGTFDRKEGGLGAKATMMVPYQQREPGGPVIPEPTPTSYDCIAYSPGLTWIMLGGVNPYGVITGACDLGGGYCDVRLTFVLPRDQWPDGFPKERLEPLTNYSRKGLMDDQEVWENMRLDLAPQWMPEDEGIRIWHEFCRGFA